MLPVTRLAISQLLNWFIGETFDRLTQHHTLNTLHINSRYKIQGALNLINRTLYCACYTKMAEELGTSVSHFNMSISKCHNNQTVSK
jgi:hypothetical protein